MVTHKEIEQKYKELYLQKVDEMQEAVKQIEEQNIARVDCITWEQLVNFALDYRRNSTGA